MGLPVQYRVGPWENFPLPLRTNGPREATLNDIRRDEPLPRDQPRLRRSLGLPLAVLYGLGVTIGAGIYVLIAPAAARAGMHAPFSFILAALVMAPSAAAFAEFGSRLPQSAGEATYVRAGLKSDALALIVGLLVIIAAVISAATVSRGSAGYINVFLDLPYNWIVITVVLAMGAITAWGILESVSIAGTMTVIEIAGLLMIAVVGAADVPDLAARLPEAWEGLDGMAAWTGVLSAVILAFFAFTGFEGLANIAEEVKEPSRTLPRAIFLTLILVTLLYVIVVWVALIAVPHDELAATKAPLSLVFEHATGGSPAVITAISIVATANGIVVFMVMGSRVLYGLAAQGLLPELMGRVNARTRTPLYATALIVAVTLLLAVVFPIEGLAEATARLSLVIFAFVNSALIKLKLDRVPAPPGIFTVPFWVPVAGLISSIGLLLGDLAY
jgi:APA family basic amino acid/polyamine antiporter